MNTDELEAQRDRDMEMIKATFEAVQKSLANLQAGGLWTLDELIEVRRHLGLPIKPLPPDLFKK